MTSPQVEEVMSYFVSIGRRRTLDGKLKYFFIEVPEALIKQQDAGVSGLQEFCFGGAEKVRGTPGAIFAIPGSGKGYAVNKAAFKGRWEDDAQVLQWAAAERSHMAEHARQKSLKDATGYDDVLASLNAAREAYSKSMGSHRPQLLAVIVDYITRGV